MIAARKFRRRWFQLAAGRPRGTALAVIALVAYLSTFIGVPVWETVDEGQNAANAPYPCQSRGCGCRSASQCWTGCCCFTNAEKVAWAKAHQVEVPDFVKQLAQLERPAKKPAATSCCAKKASCCAPAAVASCCESKPVTQSAAAPRKQVRIVAGIAALKCRGISLGWQTLGEPVGPPPARMEPLELPLALESIVAVSLRPIDRSYPPVSPPG